MCSLAESEIAILRDLIDAASSLIELQLQTHDVLVEMRCLCQIVRVEECDLRIDWRMRHGQFSLLPAKTRRYCSTVSLNVPMRPSWIPERFRHVQAVGIYWEGLSILVLLADNVLFEYNGPTWHRGAWALLPCAEGPGRVLYGI